MKAVVTIGVPASGKTSWGVQFQRQNSQEPWAIVCRDDIRRNILEEKGLMKSFDPAGVAWGFWNWKWEKEVTSRFEEQIVHHSLAFNNLILTDTNLNNGRRENLIAQLEEYGYEVETKVFSITFEEALRRDAARPNGVGVSVIATMFEKWEDYLTSIGEFEKVEFNPQLPTAVMVDVDGTLAHMKGRSPFEWGRVGEDSVDIILRDIIRGLSKTHKIIIMSGRDAVCRNQTTMWLDDNGVLYDEVFMRPEGDMRKDTVIKWELFKQYVQPHYNVVAVFDDRPSVVRMWASHGLKVFAVGNQHKEF